MKPRILFICLAAFSLLFAQPLEYVPDFWPNPGHLRMYRHIPESLQPYDQVPMVLILHGSGQTAHSLAYAGGFNKLADSLDFIAVYPDQPFYNNLLTAFQFYMPGKMKKDQGETASIRQMVRYMCDRFPIDRDRIYITGMSAGAAMANVMLNAYPDLFEAGALLAAPSILHEGVNPDHSHHPRIAIIQGEIDMTVPPVHADKLTDQWLAFHELDQQDLTVTEHYLGYDFLRLSTYTSEGTPLLVRLDIARTGHLLLVDPGPKLKQGGHYSLFTKDVDFHLPFWICEFFKLTKLQL